MSASIILNIIFFLFAVIGGIDYMMDNRLGIGEDFERGLKTAAPLILCMGGFMTLVPWIAELLSPTLGPLLVRLGADPSLIAGLLLSIDSGGAVLSKEMALTHDAAVLNGYFTASMFGSAIMGNIPLSILAVKGERRGFALKGLAFGIASIPFGSAAGGLLCGMDPAVLAGNLLPLTVISAVLVLSMIFFEKALTAILKVFGKINILICISGILIAFLGEIFGIELLPVRMSFSEIMDVIGKIILVLIGVFPCFSLLIKAIKKPLAAVSDKLGLSFTDSRGFIVNLVNSFPSIDALPDMTDTGIMINCAFGIGAGYSFGDHFAYAAATAPELAVPLIAAKLTAGIISVIGVFLIAVKRKKPSGSCL